jgi:hypothetical protein
MNPAVKLPGSTYGAVVQAAEHSGKVVEQVVVHLRSSGTVTEGMIHVIFGQRGAKNDWENINGPDAKLVR